MSMLRALSVLERIPRLRALFCPPCDPAWLADVAAGNRRPEPRIPFPDPVPVDDTAAILAYGREALRRLHWWAGLYMDRADARGIPSDAPWRGQDAMAEVIEASDHLAHLIHRIYPTCV